MSIYEPKIIHLNNTKVVISGEKTLLFLTAEEYLNKKDDVLKFVSDSFKNKEDYNFQFKADKDTLSVTIIPTTDCNLRCVYCYADGGFEKIQLDFNYVKLFLDKLIENNPDSKNINLYFAGGGEPLLNFELIDTVVKYVKKIGLKPHIKIVTNGILVEKYSDWIKENKVNLRISFDGSAQKINRPGLGFDSEIALHKTFEFLKNNYPLDLLTVQMTITKSNVNRMCEDIEQIIVKYGIDTVKIEPVHFSFSERSKHISQPSNEEFVSNYLKAIDNLINKNIKGYVDISYLSIPGTSYFCSIRNKAIISPYQTIVPCVEIIKKNTKEELILCENLKAIDFNKIKESQNNKLYKYHSSNYSSCSECNLVHFCKSNCPMKIMLSSDKSPNSYNCMISKLLIPKFLERASENDKYLNLIFGDNFKEVEKCD